VNAANQGQAVRPLAHGLLLKILTFAGPMACAGVSRQHGAPTLWRIRSPE